MTRETCDACFGGGTVYADRHLGYGMTGPSIAECPECGGTGKSRHHCSVCKAMLEPGEIELGYAREFPVLCASCFFDEHGHAMVAGAGASVPPSEDFAFGPAEEECE